VQDYNCGQMLVSGFSTKNEFVLVARAKAKTVTNNLPLLSVLAVSALLSHFKEILFDSHSIF
jgi:hypothetical protein